MCINVFSNVSNVGYAFLKFLETARARESERPLECKQGRGAERERESQPGSTLSVEPHVVLSPTTLGSRPELKSRVGWATNLTTPAPQLCSPF